MIDVKRVHPVIFLPYLLTVFVDPEDVGILSERTWHISIRETANYLQGVDYSSKPKKVLYLHREIMRPPDGIQIDHKNFNGLDNRRRNLRIVTQSENLINNRQALGRSGFRGVWKSSTGPNWFAVIKRNKVRKYLGTFATREEAFAAWQQAAAERSPE